MAESLSYFDKFGPRTMLYESTDLQEVAVGEKFASGTVITKIEPTRARICEASECVACRESEWVKIRECELPIPTP